MFKLNKHNRFHMERLEDRQMMAGDLHAFVNNGTLHINEAIGHVGGNQTVMVSQLEGGKIRLTGLTSAVNPTGSLVNGKSVVEFSGVTNIDVKLGDGQDQVFVNSSDPIVRIQNLTINTVGSSAVNDNDVVLIDNFKVLQKVDVVTGAGNDNVQINKLTSFGDVWVRPGTGDDTVRMKDSNIGTSIQGLLWFDLGTGNDKLTLGTGPADFFTPVKGRSLRVDAEDGADRVVMQDVFFDEGIAVQMGTGDDVLEMLNVKARNIALRGQDGNDTMKLTEVEAYENFFANMGDGTDTLDIFYLTARKVELSGDGPTGDGYDRLIQRDVRTPSLIRTGFEEINGQKLVKKGTFSTVTTTATR